MSFAITIDDAKVRSVFKRAPEASRKRLSEVVEEAAIDIQREMRIKAGVGATGDMRRSVRYKLDRAHLSAEIKPEAKHAVFVEYGTRPHWTSVRPGTALYRWARMKGIAPHAVQRSIARKGTKKHPFVAPTFQKMQPIVQRNAVNSVLRFVKEVDSGQI